MVDDVGRQLLAELEEEVRRKRASGELPADLERELDVAFAELAPEGAVEGDFSALMDRLDATATIDTQASTDSSRPGVAQLKRVVGKAIDWELRHLATEVSRVNQRLVRALQLLDGRVRALEESALAHGIPLPDAVSALAAGPLPEGRWCDLAQRVFAPPGQPGPGGRILLAECRDGGLLSQLQAAGLDTYGVEPSPLAGEAADVALDVRRESALGHLRSLPSASLAGVLLAGCADSLPVPALVAVLDAARGRLRPGGRILVVCSGIEPPVTPAGAVARDLAGAVVGPRQAGTWVALLESLGFLGAALLPGHGGDAQAAAGGDAQAAVGGDSGGGPFAVVADV